MRAVTEPGVDSLRQQLRERGYLSRGIERWFALDPWRSRTFWVELLTVALKAGVIIGAVAGAFAAAIMLVRNHPLGVTETLLLFALYFATGAIASGALVMLNALLLKARPSLPIDTPRALLAISVAASTIGASLLAAWWYGFDGMPSKPELVTGAALLIAFVVVSTVTFSAALLSFSIYELRRIPAMHQTSRVWPIGIAATVVAALGVVPLLVAKEPAAQAAPVQVVTTPTDRRIALVAVDGLTSDLYRSRPALSRVFVSVSETPPLEGSAAEHWATIGTGTRPGVHGVRAIEGVRLAGGTHVLQAVSKFDAPVKTVAPALRIAQRQPLPPSTRQRAYAWEILAERGISALAVNWWTTSSDDRGALQVVGPEAIFSAAAGNARRVDELATQQFLSGVARRSPQFATVYLPGLDIVLNRTGSDAAMRVATSIALLDQLSRTIDQLRARQYDIVLTGMPGDGQSGRGVIASTLPLTGAKSQLDLAPTLLALYGFPLSDEMPGSALASASSEPRIATYGNRSATTRGTAMSQEYYENLKSLGYIK